MAADDAKRFLDDMESNAALQEDAQQVRAQLVDVGKKHGYTFTQDELHAELRQRWGVSKAHDDPDTCTVA